MFKSPNRKGVIVSMTEKNVRQLYHLKRFLLVTLLAYAVLFVFMNTSYLSVDNIRRFFYSAKAAITEQQPSTVHSLSFSSTESVRTAVFKDGFAKVTSSTLAVYSKDMHRYSYHNVILQNPVIMTSEKYILCFDRGGKNLYVADSFEIVFEHTYDRTIINAAVSDDGTIAVMTEADEYKGVVTVYSSSFKERFKWFSAECYLYDLFFTAKNTVAVATITPDGENTDIVMNYINYSAGEVRETVSIADKFPVSVMKKSDNSVEILTETDIISFRGSGVNTIHSYGKYQPDCFYQDEKYTVIASEMTSQNSFIITAIDTTGNVLFSVTENNIQAVAAFSDVFLAVSGSTLIAYDKTGQTLSSEEIRSGISSVSGDKTQILLSGADFLIRIATDELIK